MPEREVVRNYLSLATLLLILAAVTGWLLWDRYQDFLSRPLDVPPEGYVFTLAPGSSGSDIVEQLAGAGLTRAGWEWKLLMRLEPDLYRSGEYRLQRGMRPQAVLARLASGRVIQYRLTLVEGWTFRQLAALLEQNDVLEPILEHQVKGAKAARDSVGDADRPS